MQNKLTPEQLADYEARMRRLWGSETPTPAEVPTPPAKPVSVAGAGPAPDVKAEDEASTASSGFNLTDAVKRTGKTAITDLLLAAQSMTSMVPTPIDMAKGAFNLSKLPAKLATGDLREIAGALPGPAVEGLDMAAQFAGGQKAKAAADAAQMVTGLPVTEMKQQYEQGQYPELVGHLLAGGTMLFGPKAVGKRFGTKVGAAPNNKQLAGQLIDANPPMQTGTHTNPNVQRILEKHSAQGAVGEPILVKRKAAEPAGTASSKRGTGGGGEVPLSDSKVGSALRPTVVEPTAKTQGGLRVGNPSVGSLESAGRSVEAPSKLRKGNKGALHLEEYPEPVRRQLELVDARVSKIPVEWLDSEGNPITPRAIEMAKQEKLAKDNARELIIDKHLASVAKANEVARKELVAKEKAHTEANKLRDKEFTEREKAQESANKMVSAEEKQAAVAQQKALDEIAAKEKAHSQAAKMVEDETRLAEAKRTIDTAVEKLGLKADDPVVKLSTVAVPTEAGKKTLTTTLRKPPKETPDTGVPFKPIVTDPTPPAGKPQRAPKPDVPVTDPNVVASTIYPTEFAAMHAANGSGRRMQTTKRLGRGKWQVVFGPDEPVANTPEALVVPDAGRFELPKVADPEVKLQAAQKAGIGPEPVPESVHLESAKRVAERRLTEGTSPTGVERRASAIEKDVNPPEAPPPAPVPAKPKPAPKKPSGGATAVPEKKAPVPVITTRSEPPKPVGGPAVTPPKIAQKAPVAPPAKAEGKAPAAPEKPATAVPTQPKSPSTMSRRELDAVTREEVAKWTDEEMAQVLAKNTKDKRLQTIIKDESIKRGERKANKPVETPTPAKADDFQPDPNRGPKEQGGAVVVASSKPANVKPQPKAPTTEQVAEKVYGKTVKVGGKGAEARANVIGELRKYKEEVDAARESTGVDEKGVRSQAIPDPPPINIEVENGPRYTIQAHQVEAALAKLEGSDNLMDKGVRGTANIPKPTNWGPTEKPSIARQADADALGMKPDITEHAEVVGPKAATKEFAPKGAVVVRAANSPKDLPATAKHAAYVRDANGIKELYVSDNPNKLAQFVDEWKERIKSDTNSYSRRSAKRAIDQNIKEGTLPEGKTWESYLSENKVDASKIKLAAVGDETFKPIAGMRVAPAKASPTKAQPEPTTPLEKGVVETPKAKASLNDTVIEQQKAADEYFRLKDQYAQDKSPETYAAMRAAGKRFGELKTQAATLAKGEGRDVPMVQEPVKAKPAPKTKGVTSDDLVKMSPEDQQKAIGDAFQEFKGKKGRVKNEKGEIDPVLLARFGLVPTMALAGAAQTPDDPLVGALMGGAAGFWGPSLFRAGINYAQGMPKGRARSNVERTVGQQIKNYAATIWNAFPDYMRASYLARFPNLVLNAWAGPHGGAILGALEAGLGGDKRGWAALKRLTDPKLAKEIRPAWKEAGARVTDAMERGDVVSAEDLGRMKGIITLPARAMTTGDVVSRRGLMDGGFTEPEARALNLTSEPHSGFAKSESAFRKTKGPKGKISPIAKLALPFYRTVVNQGEQSLLRLPVFNEALRAHWKLAPESTRKKVVKYGMSGALMGGAYQMGKEMPVETAPVMLKILNNVTGVYGASVSAAFMIGVASKKHDKLGDAAAVGLKRYIKEGVPIPTLDVLVDWVTFLQGVANLEFKPPSGVFPAVISSREKASDIPGVGKVPTSLPSILRWASGDREWARPTKNELSVAAPFVKNPKLGPRQKSAYEKQLDQIRADKARQRRAVRESAEQ